MNRVEGLTSNQTWEPELSNAQNPKFREVMTAWEDWLSIYASGQSSSLRVVSLKEGSIIATVDFYYSTQVILSYYRLSQVFYLGIFWSYSR